MSDSDSFIRLYTNEQLLVHALEKKNKENEAKGSNALAKGVIKEFFKILFSFAITTALSAHWGLIYSVLVAFGFNVTAQGGTSGSQGSSYDMVYALFLILFILLGSFLMLTALIQVGKYLFDLVLNRRWTKSYRLKAKQLFDEYTTTLIYYSESYQSIASKITGTINKEQKSVPPDSVQDHDILLRCLEYSIDRLEKANAQLKSDIIPPEMASVKEKANKRLISFIGKDHIEACLISSQRTIEHLDSMLHLVSDDAKDPFYSKAITGLTLRVNTLHLAFLEHRKRISSM